MSTEFKICNCNHTMPLDAAAGAALGAALGCGSLPVASALCRREVGSFLAAIDGVEPVVVACTQERALFSELGRQQLTAAPLRFVNLRETGGWGAEAKSSLPKMAALLAAAALPDPDPVPVVNFVSRGQVLVIGPPERALPWATRLAAQREVSVLLTGAGGEQMLQERPFQVYSGERVTVEGWLGAFTVRWQQHNPIDLEICTRCNGCVDACPEDAIDLLFQVDLTKCKSHRSCVKACGTIGAIDFARSATAREASCDLILDLSDRPLLARHQLPQGYFAPGSDATRQMDDVLNLTQLVGEFEKPKFFQYKDSLCAHGRNGKTGCTACIDICSAEAIAHDGNHIKVNPNLCAGCGACSTVCPSGAIRYAYPSAPDMGLRIKTLLSVFHKAGGRAPVLLLHGEEQGAALILQLGRLARAGGRGMPARVLPLALQHVASTGIDLWLMAVAHGAASISVLASGSEAPQYLEALEQQMAIAQAILSGLGYAGTHFSLIRADDASELESALHTLQAAQPPATRATFNVAAEKRNTLDFAISHLLAQAPNVVDEIALPTGAPFGKVQVNRAACTLCMACVGACPESALLDNANTPQLRFHEKNCVQCGLCEKTCPEGAITLTPRLLLTEAVRQPQVLNEAQPYHCIRCSKPFGTAQMIENMLGKLAAHGAFAGNVARLKMCSDCRVVDMMGNTGETSITDLKRP